MTSNNTELEDDIDTYMLIDAGIALGNCFLLELT